MNKPFLIGLTLIMLGCQSNQVKDDDSGEVDFRDAMIDLGATAKTPAPNELNKYPLGSKNNPVKVNGHRGREIYLSSLVCENGSAVSAWNRIGSVGVGPYGFIIDLYNIICDTKKGVVESTLHIDMYHDSNETRPASGFLELKQ